MIIGKWFLKIKGKNKSNNNFNNYDAICSTQLLCTSQSNSPRCKTAEEYASQCVSPGGDRVQTRGCLTLKFCCWVNVLYVQSMYSQKIPKPLYICSLYNFFEIILSENTILVKKASLITSLNGSNIVVQFGRQIPLACQRSPLWGFTFTGAQ